MKLKSFGFLLALALTVLTVPAAPKGNRLLSANAVYDLGNPPPPTPGSIRDVGNPPPPTPFNSTARDVGNPPPPTPAI